jgi:hypothetical protein
MVILSARIMTLYGTLGTPGTRAPLGTPGTLGTLGTRGTLGGTLSTRVSPRVAPLAPAASARAWRARTRTPGRCWPILRLAALPLRG